MAEEKMMTRDDLLAMFKQTAVAEPRPVVIPKFGTVYVRDVTLAEVEEQRADTSDGKDKMRMARGVCRVLCEKDGTLLFDANDPDDVRLVSQQPWRVISKIIEVAEEGN